MGKGHYIIPIFVSHEGCPHNCVFCNQDTITGIEQKVDSDYVRSTIEQYLKTITRENAVIEVSFYGGTFTAIDIKRQKDLLVVAKEFKDKGDIDFIHLSTRPDYIDEQILSNLKDYSVDIIELGVQSLDKEVLLKSGRGHSEEDVSKASKLIKEFGFILGHQIMLGLPGDTFEKDIETTRKSIDMKPEIYRIYPALVIRDTPMEKLYNEGLYEPYELYKAVEIAEIVYCMLTANKIKVIRIGLQPTEEINIGKDLIAGPFHPAFRELVEGSLYSKLILNEIAKSFDGKLIIKINNADLSKLYCYKKKFFNDMKKQLKTSNVQVIQDNQVSRGEIILLTDGNENNLSINKYIIRRYKEGNFSVL